MEQKSVNVATFAQCSLGTAQKLMRHHSLKDLASCFHAFSQHFLSATNPLHLFFFQTYFIISRGLIDSLIFFPRKWKSTCRHLKLDCL